MLLASFKRWFNGTRSRPIRRAGFRPELVVLEDRITPASLTWVGTGMGAGANWSVGANWAPAQVPSIADTLIFDGRAGVGANTNSTMDLGGQAQYHIGQLNLVEGYTSTITLNTLLYVDTLNVQSAGTITGNANLMIYQRTDDQAIGAATIFGTSYLQNGTISVNDLRIAGENAHRATFQLSATGRTVTLQSNLTIVNAYSTVNWQGGSVTVQNGKTVTNNGVFLADSTGTMGNNQGAGNTWTFQNNLRLNMGRGTFPNVTQRAGMNGRTFRVMAQGPGTNSFEIAGTYTQDQTGTLTSVESGTLLVTGTFSQTKGDVTIMGDTSLTVTSDFTESADATFNIQLTTPPSGSGLATVGGTIALNGSTLNATALSGFSGNQFTLIRNTGGMSVVGTFAGLAEGATLAVGGRTFRITYAGNLTNDVVLNWVNQPPSGANNTLSTTVGTPYTFSTADFGFSDPDGNNFLAVKITTLPTNGTLTYLGIPVYAGQFVSASDIGAGRLVYTPPGVAGSYTFTFQVQDDGGTAYGGIDTDPFARTMTINVT